MTKEILDQKYPKTFSKLDEDIDEVRYLVVVDENVNDEDSDEFDAIDPEDYNYLVYVTDRLQALLLQESEENMITLVKRLEGHSSIDLFYLSDIDLYGIQTDLNQAEIEMMILEIAEELVC